MREFPGLVETTARALAETLADEGREALAERRDLPRLAAPNVRRDNPGDRVGDRA
jgi:hypothetical protein